MVEEKTNFEKQMEKLDAIDKRLEKVEAWIVKIQADTEERKKEPAMF